jgi:hypothetical protein
MTGTAYEQGGVRIFECASDGPRLKTDRDSAELLSSAWEHHASLVAVPAQRLDEEFFDLKTGVAGSLVQKFVNYGMRLAVTGEIAAHLEASRAFRDFVKECNRGHQVWFVASVEALAERLK